MASQTVVDTSCATALVTRRVNNAYHVIATNHSNVTLKLLRLEYFITSTHLQSLVFVL